MRAVLTNGHVAEDALRVFEIVEASISANPTPEMGADWLYVIRWLESNVRYMTGLDRSG